MIVICFQITTPYPRVPVPAGIEPATLRLTAARSNQLSYRTRETFVFLIHFELKMKIKIAVSYLPTVVNRVGFEPTQLSVADLKSALRPLGHLSRRFKHNAIKIVLHFPSPLFSLPPM